MQDKKKYGEQLNVQIPPELMKDLKWYSTMMDSKIKYVVVEALQAFLNTKK